MYYSYRRDIDMLLVKATPQFVRLANKIMSTEAHQELVDHVASHPEAGQIIVGTGGIRKLRWRTGKDNKGKSGGARILYYYQKDDLILLITLFKKAEKENIDAGEKEILKKILPELLRSYGHE